MYSLPLTFSHACIHGNDILNDRVGVGAHRRALGLGGYLQGVGMLSQWSMEKKGSSPPMKRLIESARMAQTLV